MIELDWSFPMRQLRDEMRARRGALADFRDLHEAAGSRLKDWVQRNFEEAGRLVYQKAFRKGLAWVPAGHILRLSPPIVMEEEVAAKALGIIDEAIEETERELGLS